MPRKSKDQRNAEIHALALEQFEDAWTAQKVDRELARDARRFVNVRGAQWSWDTGQDFENRMKLEIDHVSAACQRIKNEFRKNRIAARFLPADGTEADDLADALASRYRADTQDLTGREARDMAFDSAVEGGLGGLRLRTEYEDGEKQRICVEPVNDAESTLFFDVNAKRKDKSDADHAFLVTPYARRAFERIWGTEATTWPDHMLGRFKYPWFGIGSDIICVAEYFMREDRTDTFRVWKGGVAGDEVERILEDDVTDEDVARLKATGFKEQEPETEAVKRIVKYVLNGAKVLEGPVIIAGQNIPLVPQYGHRTVIDHVERFRGHPAKAMDAQIVYNIQVSSVAETAAESGPSIPIFYGQQIAAYHDEWAGANKDRPAFLRIDPILDAGGNPMVSGPVSYLEPPQIPPAVAALIALTKQDIADQMGNPENAEQMTPDISGVALDLVQGRIDMQSYGYMANAADAERRLAEIWLGMASEVYVEPGRKLKTMTEDGKRGTVEIGRKILDKRGHVVSEIDFARGRFDIEVDVGPTSASRRSAIVRTVSELSRNTADPQQQMLLGHVALMNLEGEGLGDIRDFSRKRLVAMGVIKPTPEEERDMAQAAEGQQPDPQTVLAGALATEAEAKAQKAQADTVLSLARTEESKAKAAETLAGIPIEQQKAALATATAIMNSDNGGQNGA